jgi:CheY-like chemotaxis protein
LELAEAEERERRRIAVILHEDLQQQSAGARFHLNLVKGRIKDDRLHAEMEEVNDMLKDAIETSRSLSRDLSPVVANMNDLAEVLRWLVNRLQAQHGLNVSLNVVGDVALRSEALAMFLFRTAQEMLFNVVKHAHVREAAVRIRRIGRYVGLSVSDQGRGFDPQELRETPGVGLFSIRERTELLCGRMKVKSAKGKGSKFSIIVPDGADVKEGKETTEDGVLRVLLVDDHDIVREGLAALLREAPEIELVGEAADGREAINMALDLRPDVVIMDVAMPVMRGEQATRQIKLYLPETRVIALSMYDEADEKERMFQAGAEGYILKTVSTEKLVAAIRGQNTGGS